jgi:DNA-binding response OmpR family regulator
VWQLASTVLARAGYETESAERGAQALASVQREKPALVVLDVRLPDLSGYEVCRQLKDQFGDGLPIVFISGERVESCDRVAGLLIGANDYLTKPFAPDELVARVRGLIRRSEAPQNGNGALLTTRELEVLRLLAGGVRPEDIARRLSIAERTVAKHLERTLQKLGVHSRAHAVSEAYRRGLL